MDIDLRKVQELRSKTGLGVMDCRRALEEAKGSSEKAEKILRAKGSQVAAKKAERKTSQGLIDSYVHNNKIGVLLEVNCETDFVAKNPEFKELVHDLAMQVVSMDPRNIKELLAQEFIKDPCLRVGDLINQKIQKMGENIKVKRFTRYQLGE